MALWRAPDSEESARRTVTGGKATVAEQHRIHGASELAEVAAAGRCVDTRRVAANGGEQRDGRQCLQLARPGLGARLVDHYSSPLIRAPMKRSVSSSASVRVATHARDSRWAIVTRSASSGLASSEASTPSAKPPASLVGATPPVSSSH
jgi:hypothetical protein